MIRTAFVGVEIENNPSALETVPFEDPFTIIEAPLRGRLSVEERTLPVTVISCANDTSPYNTKVRNKAVAFIIS